MIKLYLVRHGDCKGRGLYIGKGSDVPLSEEGRNQIRVLSDTLIQELSGQKIDHLFSSLMKRSMESSQIISDFSNIAVQSILGLEEIYFGEWEGKSYDDIQKQNGLELQEWIKNPVNNCPPGGETIKQLKFRVISSLSFFPAMIDSETQYNIILVSHRGPIAILLLHFLDLELDKFWNFKIDRGSLSKLNIHPRFCEVEFLNRKF